MNATYMGLEIRRVLRDYPSMFFIVVLPAFFYVIFGAAQDYSKEDAGNGNVAMFTMISMAAYGAATATTGIGGRAAVERMQGWGRQLGLTPLRDSSFVSMKTLLAVTVGAIPIIITYILGVATGAEGTALAWLLSGLALVTGAMVWALYGLCAGLMFKSEAAVGAASGLLVILAFLGNIFIPLSGTMLAIAKFTPLYGYVALARYPLTEGHVLDGDGLIHQALWIPMANVGVWTAILALLATWLVRRGRARQ
jgi:ABC-2 type transport system permease protein